MAIGAACALVCSAVAASGAAARADQAIQVETVGDLPFSAAELEQVVSARVPAGDRAGAARVVVGPAGQAGVRVRVGDKSRTVAIADRTGIEAARVVALAIADLAADEIVPLITMPATPATPAPPAVVVARPPEAARPTIDARLSSGLEASRGIGQAEPLALGLAADLLGARGSWLGGAGLGGWMTLTQRSGRPDEASLAAGVVRLWGGGGFGQFQAVAGPFAAPYRLSGAVNRTGILVGGGAMLRFSQRIGRGTQFLAMIRADLFANRFQVELDPGSPSLATPRLALAMGVGIGWDLRTRTP